MKLKTKISFGEKKISKIFESEKIKKLEKNSHV